MRGANLVGVFVGGFVVCLFLWISEFCWSAGGGAEVRHWCKPGVVRGVRLEVIKVQRVVNEPVFDVGWPWSPLVPSNSPVAGRDTSPIGRVSGSGLSRAWVVFEPPPLPATGRDGPWDWDTSWD